jgi:predicted ATPase
VTSFSLFGRERELRLLNDFIDDAPKCGGPLVVRGDAGIGKSALLTVARSRAVDRGFKILSAAGVLSEAHVPFAGLQQLLQPILSHIDEFLTAQRDRVLAGFGVTETKIADVSLIALATLDLLGDVAAHSPLLLLVEDAHWLDQPTCDVLAVVALERAGHVSRARSRMSNSRGPISRRRRATESRCPSSNAISTVRSRRLSRPLGKRGTRPFPGRFRRTNAAGRAKGRVNCSASARRASAASRCFRICPDS